MLFWSQCNHGNVILTSVFICVLANQPPLSHTLPPQPLIFFIKLSKGSDVSEGGRSFSHQSPSDWQFNLIHRFHLLHFTSNNTDNIDTHTHTQMPLHIYLCIFVCTCVLLCCYMCTLLSLLSCLSGLLFSCGPILSSISCRPCLALCAPENERGMTLVHSPWYSAVKHNSTAVWSQHRWDGSGNQSRHGTFRTWANKMIAFV